MKKNALIALGGGPSPVINASLLGVCRRCLDYPGSIGKIYAARYGIEGILKEDMIDLGAQDRRELSLLKHTPASGSVGTCRYKLGDERKDDYDRIIEVLSAHNIGWFFYIGGNDSMDTADKVSTLAAEKGIELVVAGVPKTIDNDLGDEEFTIIDHTPGYGSAARYWMNIIQNTNEENRGMCVSESVAVLQAMGRKSGYITAASRLADPGREFPMQLYFAEAGLNLEVLADNVNDELTRRGRCIVVVNEGFDVGALDQARDGFGHIEYGASKTTAAQVVVNYLNEKGLKARGQATGQVPGVLQRSTSIYRSQVDINEAYEVGAHAVDIALNEGTGYMATILRARQETYRPLYDKVQLRTVANTARHLPKNWITASGLDVTDDFIRYAKPLVGSEWPDILLEDGRQRFAKLEIKLIDKQLKPYVPVGYRE